MRAVDFFRLISLAALWGGSFIFMRIASPVIGAINTAFLRVFFGFIGLALILLVLRKAYVFNGKFRSTLLLGAVNSGLPFFMYGIAAKLIPAGYSAILNATTPLMGAIIGFIFFQEKMPLRKWFGVMLGLLGIGLITAFEDANSTSGAIAGVIACLVATTCYGAAGFLTRRWIADRGGLDPKLIAFGSQVGASIFLFPFFCGSIVTGPAIDWMRADVWLSVVAVGFVCTSFAYILYFRLIADIGPLRSLTVTFLIPPFGVLWGYLILGETITLGFIIGSIIVCCAVWLVVAPEK